MIRPALRALLGQRAARHTGRVTVPGLSGPLTIRRDRHGTPVIDAASEPDAWFGLGFCHGQDRGAQLEFMRRAGSGTLAELVGPEGVAIDRQTRRIGLHRSAVAQLPALAPDVLATLTAYADGVTAGLSPAGSPRRPHEFALLGGEPQSWGPADVATYLKLQAMLVGSNWDLELARLQLVLADGPEAAHALDPALANNGPFVSPHWKPPGGELAAVAERLMSDLSAVARAVPRSSGSNAWVVAGERTQSGRPVLANDPHVAPTLPAPWYLAHLRAPGFAVCGASTVGAPGFVCGHNGTVAWGSAAGLQDNTDLFVEEIGPDRRSVRGPDGGFHPCEVRREVIRVRGRAEVVEEVLITPRGPIISPAMEGVAVALSMRAVWLDPLPARGFLDAYRATSFAGFRAAFAEWPLTPQHVVYADSSGGTGWQLAGQVPRRGRGYGLAPAPGAESGRGWDELVPFAEMPFAQDPPEGFVVAANNRPAPDDAAPHLGDDWVNGYRAGVIADELGRRRDWSVNAVMGLQLSRRSLVWEELRGALLGVAPADARSGRGLSLLRAWDGNMGADSAAATLFTYWVCELAERACKAKAPNGWRYALGEGFGGLMPHTLMGDRRFAHLARLVLDQPAGWFARGWDAEIADALAETCRRVEAAARVPLERAAWGRVRPLKFTHLVFGAVPGLKRLFNPRPLPGGGDSNTVFQMTVQPLDPLAPPSYLPNLRAAIDVGAWPESRFVIAGGQSGNPLSANYADQLAIWARGEGVAIPWAEAEVAAATVATLELAPPG